MQTNARFDFSGRKVFVFGGTSGINLGIAEAFAERGAVMAAETPRRSRPRCASSTRSAVAPASWLRPRALRRIGTPTDAAGVCLFLASDTAAYVSGVVIAADGGWAAAGARWT
ncbi:MAG: SDR family oxidoreductase [Ideonella sp.]|nr:SDR family oxidoreductase [Ideonella sp.]MCC7459546.1 SDR family oxidoreductase [Nitrospira sp.]